MTGPTPGPWKYGHKGFDALWVGPDYDQIPTAIVPWDCEDARASARENARLIAAAPDMLTALSAAVECGMVPVSSASDGGAARHSRQVEVADMIRAAITKATNA